MNEKQIWQFMQRALYSLKRQYGAAVTVITLDDAETNYQTGVKTITKTIHNVRRAVVLPEEIKRQVEQGIAHLSANKMFVSQAGFDLGQVTFIFDAKDLPVGFTWHLDDHILVDGDDFKVTVINEFEFDSGWIITGQRVNGDDFTGTIALSATTPLTINQGAST